MKKIFHTFALAALGYLAGISSADAKKKCGGIYQLKNNADSTTLAGALIECAGIKNADSRNLIEVATGLNDKRYGQPLEFNVFIDENDLELKPTDAKLSSLYLSRIGNKLQFKTQKVPDTKGLAESDEDFDSHSLPLPEDIAKKVAAEIDFSKSTNTAGNYANASSTSAEVDLKKKIEEEVAGHIGGRSTETAKILKSTATKESLEKRIGLTGMALGMQWMKGPFTGYITCPRLDIYRQIDKKWSWQFHVSGGANGDEYDSGELRTQPKADGTYLKGQKTESSDDTIVTGGVGLAGRLKKGLYAGAQIVLSYFNGTFSGTKEEGFYNSQGQVLGKKQTDYGKNQNNRFYWGAGFDLVYGAKNGSKLGYHLSLPQMQDSPASHGFSVSIPLGKAWRHVKQQSYRNKAPESKK